MDKNKEALSIYLTCSTQLIVAGMGEPIGINYLAVKMVMDLYGVVNQKDCFEKVIMVSSKILEIQRSKK
jgi:hypothetical protein